MSKGQKIFMPDRRQRFEFRHLLTRDAAYEALLASNRRALHAVAADVLKSRLMTGSPEELSQLAIWQSHLELAQRWEEAHRVCCTRLLRRANLGRLDGWLGLAEHAAALWDKARQRDHSLAETSPDFANAQGLYFGLTSKMAEAAAWAERALALARETEDTAQEALAYNNCGLARHYSGQHAQAIEFYKLALASFQLSGNIMGVTQAHNNLGLALHESGNSEEARTWLQQGLDLARLDGNLLLEANLALNLGIAEAGLKQSAAARRHYERAYEVALALGDVSTQSFAIGYLGSLAKEEGSFEAAFRQLELARALSAQMRQPRITAWWLGELASLRELEGRVVDAIALATECLQLARGSGDRFILAHALFLRAKLAMQVGEVDLARSLFAEMEAVAQDAGLMHELQKQDSYTELQRALQDISSPGSAQS
jgi:tetratricopeptide (TPR) repeat protein